MEKIYGYKEKDLVALAKKINERGERPLARIFEEFAKENGKAKGTVRNMYYALAKASRNKEFAQNYGMQRPIEVNDVKKFTDEEEKELVKKIILGKTKGKSVRRTINELSEGDVKKALRLQNKYRNSVKSSGVLEECEKELISCGKISADCATVRVKKAVGEDLFNKLKKDVDFLVSRLRKTFERENLSLREKLNVLEAENLSLKRQVFSQDKGKSDIIAFLKEKKSNTVN